MAKDQEEARQNKFGAPASPNGMPFTPQILEALFTLTEMQQGFALNYTVGPEGVRGNATQSAIRAGYSKKQAAAQGSGLLRNKKVKRVMDLIKIHIAKKAELDLNTYLRLLLQQANSWLTPEGKPKEEPLVSSGAVVVFERTVVDKEGIPVTYQDSNGDMKVRTVNEIIMQQWRPNASNTRALELIGQVLGYVGVPRGNGTDKIDPASRVDAGQPREGYKDENLPDQSLDEFLRLLPRPEDIGPRTGVKSSS